MRKIVLFFTMLMLASVLVFAQTRTVTGKVVDETGQPLSGATILVKGTSNGTSAGNEGTFRISAKAGDVIQISATNFATTEITVGSQSNLAVKLTRTGTLMDEVIVTAGGIRTKRREIGTATSVVRGEALVAGKALSVAGGLQGKVAGLQINATGGGVNPNFRLVLRGQRSLTGNNQALIVLDNVIVPNEILGNLNPEDVQDVTVLNGAGAAALYGSQASNGAVIITTKKGRKGINAVRIANTTTIEQVAFFPKIQDRFGAGGSAYGHDLNGKPLFSYLENQSYGPAFDGTIRPLGVPLENGFQDSALYAFNKGHNQFWQSGVTNQSDIALTSGDENSTFYLSGQYANVTGTTPGDKYNRASLRVNGTRKIGNRINVSYNTNYIQNRYNRTTQTGSMYANMLNMPSNVDITRYKNWRTDPLANPNGFYNPWYQNPYFTADNYREIVRNDYLTGSVELRFTPIAGLDLVARQGLSTRNYSGKGTVEAFTYTDYAKHTEASSKSDIPASVSDNSGYSTQLLSDFFAQYNRQDGEFSLKAIAGGQWRQDESKGVNLSATGLVVPGLFNVSNGVGTPGASEGLAKARQMGVYGDVTFGYKNYLFLHGTGRNDWVSILSAANRAFFYPAVDLSFVASDAIPAIKSSNTVSYLKVRGGWSKVGQVNLGSANFGAYNLLPTYSPASGFPFGSLAGYTVGNRLVSNDIKPEITKGYEVGLDLNLFKDRVTSTITWYNTKTDNQTVNTAVSNATGFTGLLTNTGQTQSKGLEVTAHVTPVRNRDWNVTFGGNYTYLNNKVNYISAALPSLALATYGNSSGSYALPGRVFPVIMGFDYKRDPQGHVIVDGISGLPTRSDTISVLGSAVNKNRLSFDASVSYKNFTFSFLFEYRGGAQILNNMGSELDWAGTGYRTAAFNRERFVFPNSVIADGTGKYVTNTNVTVKNGNGNNGFWTDGINRDVTSNYVTSGDFWKLREVSLSYEVPASLLDKSHFIKGVTISAQARNLLMFMAKDNYYTDPEYSDAGNESNGVGLTGIGQSPPSRFYGATIAFRF